MSQPPGPVVIGITKLIRENGPMTRSDLSRELDLGKESVASVISRMGKVQKMVPRRLYICGWVYEGDGERRYPRAQYALGDKPDKPKPRPDLAATSRLYRERNYGQVSSVWDLGTPRRAMRALHRLT